MHKNFQYRYCDFQADFFYSVGLDSRKIISMIRKCDICNSIINRVKNRFRCRWRLRRHKEGSIDHVMHFWRFFTPSLIFHNAYGFKRKNYAFENTRLKIVEGYNHGTVSSNNREILRWHMESYYKTISKIRNITFIFQNFEKKFQKGKKNVKNSYGFCI